MRKCKHLLVLFFTVLGLSSYAQLYHDYAFEQQDSIVVLDTNNRVMKWPWAGGMSHMQFLDFDVDFDGDMDILAFDKIRNWKYVLINENPTPGIIEYRLTTDYVDHFPTFRSWAQSYDVDGDGKNDLVYYSVGNIAIALNVGNATNGIQFKHRVKMLFYHNTNAGYPLNIAVSSEEYPVFEDMDGDGDHDVLVFELLGGTLLNYFENKSVELFSHPDSLHFELEDRCWGKFAESDSTNALILNYDCSTKKSNHVGTKGSIPKHVGSSTLALDLDGDGDKDLLVADVDYPGVVALINGGTTDSAVVSSQILDFPVSHPINVFSMPVLSYLDVDNDGLKDLIAAPFDGSFYRKSQNHNNIWFYKNTGTNAVPVFSFQKEALFQDEMIDVGSGATPVFHDYNNDGLLDLFVSNYGYVDTSYYYFLDLVSEQYSQIALFENIGTTTQPKFKLITRDYANISDLEIADAKPAFADIDGDSDVDMMLGRFDGTLIYFENLSNSPSATAYAAPQYNYDSIDVGKWSAPQFFDLNNDGLQDLLIGNQGKLWKDQWGVILAKKASIVYYQNTGSATNPQFTYITDSLGAIDVTDSYLNYSKGYSTPMFFRQNNGPTHAFIGSATGVMTYYKNIDNNLNGVFDIDTNINAFYYATNLSYDSILGAVFQLDQNGYPTPLFQGHRITPAVGDLNGDQYPDMVCGNFSGGLTLYYGVAPPLINANTKAPHIPEVEFVLYPNPANHQVEILIDNIPQGHFVKIQLLNILGQPLQSLQASMHQQHTISLQGQSNGVYLVQLQITDAKGQVKSQSIKRLIKK